MAPLTEAASGQRGRGVMKRKMTPLRFIETVLHDPETGRPFVLLPAERPRRRVECDEA